MSARRLTAPGPAIRLLCGERGTVTVVRFGIAGFGLHAVKRLMPGFRQAQRSTVVALSRRDPERARASAAEYGIPFAFTSVEELCRAPEVDAVFVATPNSSHL